VACLGCIGIGLNFLILSLGGGSEGGTAAVSTPSAPALMPVTSNANLPDHPPVIPPPPTHFPQWHQARGTASDRRREQLVKHSCGKQAAVETAEVDLV
jgi:hypothetical protein